MKAKKQILPPKISNRNQLGRATWHALTGGTRMTSGALSPALRRVVVLFLGVVSSFAAADNPFVHHEPPSVVGRWDLVVAYTAEQTVLLFCKFKGVTLQSLLLSS